MRNFHILVDIEKVMVDENPNPVLGHIRFKITGGDSIGILGDSGAGKSSLAKILSSTAPPTWNINGTIQSSIERLHILYLLQDPGSAFPPYLKIKDVWKQISYNQPKDVDQNFFNLISRINLDSGLLNSFPGWLSGGEKQRFLLAMGLSVEPDVIILDEPTSSLDSKAKEQVIDIIDEYKSKLTIIAISHDFDLIEGICKKVIFIHKGTIIESVNVKDEIKLSMLTHQHSRLLLKTYRKKRLVREGVA